MSVVIGKRGHRISEADAMDNVFGYTVGVDVSARYLPDLPNTLLGKSYSNRWGRASSRRTKSRTCTSSKLSCGWTERCGRTSATMTWAT